VALGTKAIVSDAHHFDQDFGDMIQVRSKESPEEWALAIESTLGKKKGQPKELNLNQEKAELKAMFASIHSTIRDLGKRA
jgi:hypothetical protein